MKIALEYAKQLTEVAIKENLITNPTGDQVKTISDFIKDVYIAVESLEEQNKTEELKYAVDLTALYLQKRLFVMKRPIISASDVISVLEKLYADICSLQATTIKRGVTIL